MQRGGSPDLRKQASAANKGRDPRGGPELLGGLVEDRRSGRARGRRGVPLGGRKPSTFLFCGLFSFTIFLFVYAHYVLFFIGWIFSIWWTFFFYHLPFFHWRSPSFFSCFWSSFFVDFHHHFYHVYVEDFGRVFPSFLPCFSSPLFLCFCHFYAILRKKVIQRVTSFFAI